MWYYSFRGIKGRLRVLKRFIVCFVVLKGFRVALWLRVEDLEFLKIYDFLFLIS